jgi:hypothetical protein
MLSKENKLHGNIVYVMKDHVELAFDFLDFTLITEEARERLRSISANLPLLDVGGFELRIANDSSTVDFFTCLKSKEFNEFNGEFDSDVRCLLERCIQATEDRFSEFYPFIKRIDLEFDLENACEKLRMPSVFFNVTQSVSEQRFISPKVVQDLRAYVLGDGEKVNCTIAAITTLCFDRRPQGSFISYIGIMARDGSKFRLVFGGVDISSIEGFLISIGLVSLVESVNMVIERLKPFVSTVCMVDLDLGETICPKVGIEFYIYPPNNFGLWSRLLDNLVDLNLCDRQKRDGLKVWLDSTTLPVRNAGKNHVRITDLFPCEEKNTISIFWRSINHMKVVFSQDQPLQCKAYLGFGHKCVNALPKTKQFEAQ